MKHTTKTEDAKVPVVRTGFFAAEPCAGQAVACAGSFTRKTCHSPAEIYSVFPFSSEESLSAAESLSCFAAKSISGLSRLFVFRLPECGAAVREYGGAVRCTLNRVVRETGGSILMEYLVLNFWILVMIVFSGHFFFDPSGGVPGEDTYRLDPVTGEISIGAETTRQYGLLGNVFLEHYRQMLKVISMPFP